MSVTSTNTSPSSSSPSSTANSEAANTALVETQLLSEFAQAVESTMVPIPVDDFISTKSTPAASITKAYPSRPSKKRKAGSRGDGLDLQSKTQKEKNTISALVIPPTQRQNPRDPALVSAKHRRFGSEESDLNLEFGSIPLAVPSEGEGFEHEDEEGDDDEAPEAVTAAAGYEASRSAALDAAKTASRQKSALKAQRRDKDARLKTQAQTAKSQRYTKISSQIATGVDAFKNDIEAGAPAHQKVLKSSAKAALPALLPDELLAAEPVIQKPQILLPSSSHLLSKKIKLSEKKKKGPKDIRRGNTIVRVMQSHEGILPPKSSSTSKSVREKWLRGERGFLGAASVPRQKTTRGFAR